MLRFDAKTLPAGPGVVSVHGLSPRWLAFLAASKPADGLLGSMLRVAVVSAEAADTGASLPDVLGRYEVSTDTLRFIPRFPFARGVRYRARFRPRLIGDLPLLEASTLEFSLPAERGVSSTQVEAAFPSSGCLPENLLRFYVRFSQPMQRGQVEKQVLLLEADGEPAADVLYRTPVELWDHSMRHLTILLGPGRLKRGVGPNIALGPPLKEGQEYTLAVGAGILDASGQPLRESFHKRFRIIHAVREPIAVEQWKLLRPPAGSRHPLTLTFPRPLDWAMLWRSITVESADNSVVDGRVTLDDEEKRWSFVPMLPWSAGSYQIHVAPGLEDVCGNSVVAAFDGPLQSNSALRQGTAKLSIAFRLERTPEPC